MLSVMSPGRLFLNRYVEIAVLAGFGGALTLVLECMWFGYPIFLAAIFGFFSWGFVAFAALVFGAPLYAIQRSFRPKSWLWAPTYLLVGTIGAVLFQNVIFGNLTLNPENMNRELAKWYAPIGTVAALCAWVAMRFGGDPDSKTKITT